MSAVAETRPDRPDVFVSYSRLDGEFVHALVDALATRGKDVWVDLEDIPATAEWMAEIDRGIDVSGAFAFVISPDSLSSEACARELARALASGKRIVPLLRREPGAAEVPPALASRNWIRLRDGDDFDAGIETVVGALDTDLDWVRAHTRLLVRAREWEAAEGDTSGLLRGAELRQAESALRGAAGNDPPPTPLQAEYVLASRRGATRRSRILLGSSIAALVVSLVLGGVALLQWRSAVANEHTARSRELAGSSVAQLGVDPELALLLALRAEDLRGTPEAYGALRRALLASHVRRTVRTAGHTIVLGPDGTRALSTGADTTLWDLDRRRLLARIPGFDASFSRDGSRVVAVDRGTVRVLDRDGHPVSLLHAHADSAILGARGRGLATRDGDRVVTLREAATGRLLGTLRGDTALGVNGLAAKLQPGRIRVVDVDSGRTRTIGLGETVASTVAFSDDGSVLLTKDPDGRLARWDARTGVQLYGAAREDPVPDGYAIAAVAPGGRRVVGATRNYATESGGPSLLLGGAHVAHLSSPGGRLVATLRGHASFLEDAVFSADGRAVATASDDGTARVWDARTGRRLLVLRDGAPVTAVRFAPGNRILTGDTTGVIRIWDASAGEPARIVPGRSGAVSPGGLFAAAVDGRRVLRLDVGRDRVRAIGAASARDRDDGLEVGDDGRVSIAGPDPDRIVAPGSGSDARAAAAARVHSGDARSAASLDGSVVATAAGDQALVLPSAAARVWDGATGRFRFTLPGAGTVFSVAVSPDGQHIATGAADGTVTLWNARDGSRVRVLTRHSDRVLDVAFSPDGDTVASASRDTTARLVSTGGGAPIVLGGHGDAVETVAFSDDGALVLTTGGDHTARLWEAATGQQLAAFPVRDVAAAGLAHGAAAFGPGNTIVTAARTAAVHVYACDVCRPVDGLVALARTRVTRTLSREERIRYLHERP